MSLRSFRSRIPIAPLLAAILTAGCASLANPLPPVLRIRTDTVVATVRTVRGDTLGTTPLERRVFPRVRQTLVLTAPGYDSAVVTVGRRAKEDLVTLINPLSWFIDGATGAAWVHDPGALDVALTPLPLPLPVPVPDEPVEALSDAELAVVYDEFAGMAESVGCEPLLVEALRDAADVLERAGPAAPPVPDSVRRIAAEEVERARPEMRELCARPTPQLERLRQIRESLEGTAAAAATMEDGPPLLSPVFFGPNEWEIRDDSVRARLRALGTRLRDEPVSLIVEGYADGAEMNHRELGAQRAHAVIRAMQAGGLAADCCVAVSYSGAPAAVTQAGEPWLSRRVTFTLDYARPR